MDGRLNYVIFIIMISELDLMRIVHPLSSEYVGNLKYNKHKNKSIGVVRELVNSFRDSVSNKKLKDLNNDYLIESLTKFRYKNNRGYVLGGFKYNNTMTLINGVLILVMYSSPEFSRIEKFIKSYLSKISEVDGMKVISYYPSNMTELDKVILYIMKLIKNINIYDKMIKFRLFSILESNVDIQRLSSQLDNSKIYNYGVDSVVPSDVPSINYDPARFIINLPEDLNDCQYDISDYLRSLKLRNKMEYSRNIIRFIIKDRVTPQLAYKIVIFLIDTMGYTILCPGTKY